MSRSTRLEPPAVRAPHGQSRRRWLVHAGGLPVLLAAGLDCAVAQPSSLRFGILPLGGAFESRNDWDPLLADLSRTIGRAVTLVSVSSYESLEQAIQRNEVDMAFLSGKMAVDAVTTHGMRVLAQVTRHDGLPGYRATLLVRRDGPIQSLDNVLAAPEKWRLARGEPRSLSGYIVPQLQLFLPNRIRMETRFASELVGSHQRTALAVANQEADVGTNNTADYERFLLQFPGEAAKLKVIWASDIIPHGAIVIRRQFPPEFQAVVQRFFTGYARAQGPRGDAQRAVLKALHDFAGFVGANNASMIPAERLTYELAKQSARSAQWINAAALDARLQRIEVEHAARMAALAKD